MASYDSDSSSEGGNDISTNVTLGYASNESSGDEISHIGGHPTWLDDKYLPPAALAKCKVCNGYMSLLLQLHADLQQHFPNDQRRLHVWCCKKKACSKKLGSIRSFREVKKGRTQRKMVSSSQSTELKTQKQNLGSQLFGGPTAPKNTTTNPFSTMKTATNGNPFASASSLAAKPPQKPIDETESEPPSETFAEKLKIGTPAPANTSQSQPSEPWPSESTFPPPYPFFYLDAETEYLDPTPVAPAESSRITQRTEFDTEDTSSSSAKADKDTFESNLDRTFQKFSDTIAQNPEQVLRYEFKGSPLLYSSSDNTATHFVLPHGKTGPIRGIPKCENCGAQRAFEMQLVPGLIYEIEKDDEKIDLDAGMEWGTLIIGTCSNNCGDEDVDRTVFREEWVGVQWEESATRR